MKEETHTYRKLIRNIGDVLIPFVIYYLVYLIAIVGLTSWVINILRTVSETWRSVMLEQEATVNGVIGGFAMLLGIVPLIPAFKREIIQQEKDRKQSHSLPIMMLVTITLAITSSVAINILFILFHFTENSETYSQVSERQYGVIFLFGLFLYGIVSPLAEEVVFRGIIYNRMKKYFPVPLSILLSSLLFGIYHGNLVQAAYGLLMGMLIAYTYEKFGSFLYAFLFHAAANVSIYTITGNQTLYDMFITPYVGVIFAVISIALLFLMKNISKVAFKKAVPPSTL